MQVKQIGTDTVRRAFLALVTLLCMALIFAVLPTSAFAQGHPSLVGKTVLVTGSTDGLGREVATRLGLLGAHVLVHGRNTERGEEVVEAINAGPGTAAFYRADLGSLQEVRELAAQVIGDNQQLHLLVNNAGIASGFNDGQKAMSDDGYEMIFQVNYLSHYLLTDLLLPLLEHSAPSRIVNVASIAQRPLDLGDITDPAEFDAGTAYAHSKLAMVMHTFTLAEQLAGTRVTINALHPATMMNTSMVREMGGRVRSTVDEGASAVINLAVGDDVSGRSGLYFNGQEESRANDQAYDSEAREALNALSRRLANLPPAH